jgi:Dodecin
VCQRYRSCHGPGDSGVIAAASRLSLRDLRIAEAHRFDVTVEDGKVKTYRVRLDVSFKYGSDVTGAEGDQAEEW